MLGESVFELVVVLVNEPSSEDVVVVPRFEAGERVHALTRLGQGEGAAHFIAEEVQSGDLESSILGVAVNHGTQIGHIGRGDGVDEGRAACTGEEP